MRIEELIHTHALLFEVRLYLAREDAVPTGAFADYDALRICPHHIHRGKDAHATAIDRLLRGFDQVEPTPQAVHA